MPNSCLRLKKGFAATGRQRNKIVAASTYEALESRQVLSAAVVTAPLEISDTAIRVFQTGDFTHGRLIKTNI
jgi:hypothetical protein